MKLLNLARFVALLTILLSSQAFAVIDFANLDFATAANNMCPGNAAGDRDTTAPANDTDFDFGETKTWQNTGLINGICIDVRVSLVTNVNNQAISTVGNAIRFSKKTTGTVQVRYDFFQANTTTNELIYPQFMLGDIDLDQTERITFPEVQIGSYITGENPPDGSGLGTNITVADLGADYRFSNGVSNLNSEPRNAIIVEFTPIGFFAPSYYSSSAGERWYEVTGNIDPNIFFGNWTRFPVDVTPPTRPTVTTQTTDNITPVISGTTDAYMEVTVVVGGATYILQPYEVPSGTWSINTRTRTPNSGTFNPNISGTANQVVVTSTDPGNNSSTDNTTNELTINAAPASKVVFTQAPTSQTAGVNFSPTITAEIRDVYDHVLNTGATVTLSIASGTGALDGTTSVTAVNGVATFAGINIDEAGSFTLRVASSGLTSATSASFTISTAAASTVSFVQEPTNATAGTNFSPTITAEIVDAFGNRINTSANVTLAIASGTGALDGTLTVAAVNGLATLSIINIDEAGSFTLSVASTGLTTDTSASFTISPAAALAVRFIQEPTNRVAGVDFSPTITAEIVDAFGNRVNSTANITLAIASGTGALDGTLTRAAVAGLATFTAINIDEAGSFTLSAASTGLTTDTSASFTISPAAASAVSFIQEPTNRVAGVDFSPTMTAEIVDAFGNRVNSTANITLAIASGTGALDGTLTRAAVAGLATFTTINIDEAGSFTLSAASTGLTTDTSASFTISPAAASVVSFIQEPTSEAAGDNFSPTITAEILDAFGNRVNSSANVTLAIASGTGSLDGTVTVAATSGLVTFSNINIDEAGSFTLSVASTGLTTDTSASFTISPAAALAVRFIQEPTNRVAGVDFSPTITAEIVDAFGNRVNSTANITLAIASGTGTLDGTLTRAAVAGLATFTTINIDEAGTFTLSAASTGLTTDTSASFTISPAAASAVSFIQEPTNRVAGVDFSPTMTAEIVDAFGNRVNSTANITLAIASGTGALDGTLTRAAVAGLATFTTINIDEAGSFTLSAASTGLTTDTSASFAISPASASAVNFIQEPTSEPAGTNFSPTITAEIVDAFGNRVNSSANVTLAIASGTGSLDGTVTVAATSGLVTFSNINIDEAGSFTLSVASTGLTTDTSASFAISVGAASAVNFIQEPTNRVAGIDFSPTMTAEIVDAFGNRVNSTANITLAIASGTGALDGTLTRAAVAGLATFTTINIDEAGSFTLSAASTGLTTDTSASFTISPAAASAVNFIQEPTSETAGDNFAPTITAEILDAFGNRVNSSANVTLAIASGTGALDGTVTVAASSGLVTFSNINIDEAGSFTLSVASSGLTGDTSASFAINVGAAATVNFIQEPTSETAGDNFAPTITAEIVDAFGNRVNSSANVTLAIASGTGSLDGTVTVAAVAGLVTFSTINIDEAGSFTLSVASSGLTSDTSASFAISAGAAAAVSFIQEPTSETAGDNFVPTITAEIVDAFGNRINSSANVTLAITSGTGALDGTVTVAAVNGLVTFSNINIDEAGSFTLSVASSGLSSDTSASFAINVGAASSVNFIQEPTSETAGDNFAPTITAEIVDAFGNRINSSANVTLAIASGTGALDGTVTVAASSGLVTFSNINIDEAGSFTLSVASSGLTGDTSASFAISAGAPVASTSIITTSVDNAEANSIDTNTVVVEIRDQFSNPVLNTAVTVLLDNTGSATVGTIAASTDGNGRITINLTNSVIQILTIGFFVGPAIATDTTSVTFNAGAPVLVRFVQEPTNASAGSNFSPTMTAEIVDAFGNRTLSNTNVTLAIASGTGALDGTVTVSAVNGLATFSSINIDEAGSFTLSVASSGLMGDTSASFTISAGPAAAVSFIQEPTSETAGDNFAPTITAEIVDAFGNRVNSSANVTLAIASGTGSLDGTVTVAASSGLVTFSNINIDEAGSFTLSAASSGLTTDTSSSFVISPAAATAVNFIQEPTSETAGDNFAPTITAEIVDQFGNRVNSSANVTLAIASGTGLLDGTVTVATSSGLVTFSNINIDEAGSFTLSVASSGLTGDTSASFAISAGAAAAVSFIQEPTSETAGDNFAPTITAEIVDAFDNRVNSSANVTLAIASGTGLLDGTVTVAASSGLVTFSAINIDEAGSFTLSVSSSGLTGDTSASFAISAGTASAVSFIQEPTSETAGDNFSPTITAEIVDTFGNRVNSSANVALAIASGTGSLDGTVTVAASSGLVTFSNINIDEAGSFTLSVASSGLTGDTSASFAISAGAAAAVNFIQEPTSETAGDNFAPTITAEIVDAFGNRVNSSANVILAIASGTGALDGTVIVAASSGLVTFSNINIDEAGSFTLSAASTGLTTDTSATFTISAGAAAAVSFIQEPTSETAGDNFAPTITAEIVDAFGNRVNSSANVTLAIVSGTGSLDGTVTVAAVNGLVTFSAINIDEAGSFTLSVASTGLSTDTSSSFVISPAAASTVSFVQEPTSETAGDNFAPTITAEILDQFGNRVNNSANVTLAIASGTGSLDGTVTVAASSGLATFSAINIDEAGSFTLSVASSGLTGDTSSSFTISPAAASAISFVQEPGNRSAGVNFSPNITAEIVDQFGNRVNSSANVTLAIASGTGALDGTVTVAAVNGLVTFSNINIDEAGSFTLSAASSGLTTDTTASFAISAGAPVASTSIITTSVDNAEANGLDTNTVVVEIRDQFNNPVLNTVVTVLLDETGSATVGTIASSTDANGRITINLTNSVAENLTLGFIVGVVTATDTTSVTFMAGPTTDSDNDGVLDLVESGEGTDPHDDDSFRDTDGDNTPDALEPDADNDGLTNSYESASTNPYGDNDADGIPNYLDKDDKGDGTAGACTDVAPTNGICDSGNALDPLYDTDQDGNPNHIEEDSDNDGVSDSVEFAEGSNPYDDEDFKDTDGDGTPDALETDADKDGLANTNESAGANPYGDNDSDGIPNYLDKDDKGDGTAASCTDTTPANGICDAGEALDPSFDADQDGIPNHAELDADDDGAPDSVENAEGTDAYDDEDFIDSDNDGTPDAAETDSDNDGIDNDDESEGTDPYGDNDDDGIPNYLDKDDKGDGSAAACTDTTPINGICDLGQALDPEFDTDGDGTANHADEDSDNDGAPDSVEIAEGTDPYDEEDFKDTDSDGTPDAGEPDSDNDGDSNSSETNGNDPYADNDDDGIPDYLDKDDKGNGTGSSCIDTTPANGICDAGQALDPIFDIDADGIPNHIDKDTDGDDVPDSVEKAEGSDHQDEDDFIDTDGDDVPDALEDDSDEDGIDDQDESEGIDPYGDNDDDGIPDYLDKDDKGDGTLAACTDTTPVNGVCDLGEALDPVFDADQDGNPNHTEEDSDNDGVPDSVERAEGTDPYDEEDFKDTDGDGIPDAIEPDADNDGIPNDDESEGNNPYGDNDDDGIPDYLDKDDKGDGNASTCTDSTPLDGVCDVGEALDPVFDTDGDGIPNHADEDSDGDEVPDSVEIAEGTDPYDEEDFKDTDGDGTPDAVQPDSDDDGISDIDESDGIDPYGDNDDDGIPNYLDEDDKGDGTVASCTDTSPNDGICDEGEALDPLFDTDQDGTPNHADDDSDDDGVPDSVEIAEGTDPYNEEDFKDADDDGISDAEENDSDNDGIPNTDESDGIDPYGDNDDDGIPNYLDKDDKGDGTAAACIDSAEDGGNGVCDAGEALDPVFDADGDGIPNHVEIDSDADGIPDVVEGTDDEENDGTGDGSGNAYDTDSDNDGISDSEEAGVTGDDSDVDGIDDAFDVDSTGGTDANTDGIDDARDEASEQIDTDEDGTPDYLDPDSDDDGIPDVVEGNGDNDGDDIPNYLDLDSDGDGIPDEVESGLDRKDDDDDDIDDAFDVDDFIDNGTPGDDDDNNGVDDDGLALDTDGDDVPDYLDLDSDNDTIPDVIEAGLPDEDQNSQADDDDLTDTPPDTDEDGTPDYIDTDSNNDGTLDIDDAGNGDLDLDDDGDVDDDTDTDGDGIPDVIDDNDGFGTGGEDSDGDGKPDSTDPDDDNDGIPDEYEGNGDSDGDGIPDYLDTDSDGDGVSDLEEVSTVPASGVDEDNDGIDDAFDVDFTGGPDLDNDGIDDSIIDFLEDTDGDGVVNYLDTDSDNDGYSDFDENGDYNNDGILDRLQKEADIETARQGMGSMTVYLLMMMLLVYGFRVGGFSPTLRLQTMRDLKLAQATKRNSSLK